MLTTGSLFIFLISYCGISRRSQRVIPWRYSITYATLVVPAQIFLFKSIDLLNESNRAALVYPLVTGTCIISFVLYSIFLIKENSGVRRTLGVLSITIGVVMTSWG